MKKLIIALSFALAGCGGGNSVSNPSPVVTGPPAVAGSYSGTTIFAAPSNGTSFTCAATTSVTQSGSTVSIAPVQLSGGTSCNGLSLPFGSGPIDGTGSIGSASGVATIGACNYNWVASGGFFGRQLQVSIAYNSAIAVASCGPLNVTINLTRS